MLVVSWSKIKRWRRCKKAYDYRYNQKLTKKRKNIPLFRGVLLHEMLSAQTMLALHPTAPRDTPEDILRKAAKKNRILLKEEKEFYGDIIDDCRRIFDSYNRHYAKDPLKPISSEEFVSTPISDDIQFMGYIDNRVEDKDGRFWIRDYKTCSHIPDEESRFSDVQLVKYGWAWNRANPGKEVSGVIWDYIRTKPPTIPEQLKNGELSKRANIDTDYHTYRAEIDRLKLNPKDYADILAALDNKKSTSFARIKYPLPPRKAMDSIIEDMRESAIEIRVLGKSVHTRTMSYDCKSCEFFELCQAELRGLDTEYIKKSSYTVRENDNANREENSETNLGD